MIENIFYIVLVGLIIQLLTRKARYPVAVLGGLYTSPTSDINMDFVGNLSENLQQYVQCIQIGDGVRSSHQFEITRQGEEACKRVNENPYFQDDFIIVGLSQGSLIARYVLEKCQLKGNIKKYMSIGGMQMGVNLYPNCTSKRPKEFCDIIDLAFNNLLMNTSLQASVSLAGYWRDIQDPNNYQKASKFIAGLNNEGPIKQQIYKDRILGLESFIMAKFLKEQSVFPRSSSWFGFSDEENGKEFTLYDTLIYQQDYLGLKELDQRGKLQFLNLSGPHLFLTQEEIEMLSTYLY